MIGGRVRADAAAGGGGLVAVRSGYVATTSINPIPAGGVAIPTVPLFAVPASVGDFVELQLSFMAVISSAFLDTAVTVGGALVRYASTGSAAPPFEGDPVFYTPPANYRTSGYGFGFEAEAGDLSGGVCSVAMVSFGAAGGTLYMDANYPLRWVFKNYGGGLT